MSDSTPDLRRVAPAIVDIYQQHFQELVGYVARMIGVRAVAEECAQEAGIRLMQASLNESIDNPKAYLYFVASNLARDHLRHQLMSGGKLESLWLEGEIEDDRTAQSIAAQAQLHQVQIALQQLPAQARRIFELVRVEGFSYKEVAESLAISPKTVENHMTRAIAKLSELLGEPLDRHRRN